MALVEEDVRQLLRERFSQLPEPVFNECLRTNPTNLEQCMSQLYQQSQVALQPYPMCGASAGMDPAHHRQQPTDTGPDTNSLVSTQNSDGWVRVDWSPTMHPGGDTTVNHPHLSNRTPEASEPSSGWQGYRQLYNNRQPVQVSKLSVNLHGEGWNPSTSTAQVQPSDTSPVRTYGRASGNITPGTPGTPSTPDSSGLDRSINLPGASSPMDRCPSPSTNPFFPPINDYALRASQSNGRLNFQEGRSSPGVTYLAQNSASSRPSHGMLNTSPSTLASAAYNSNNVGVPPTAAVVQPNVVSSHPVAPLQLNNPSPDVRRRTPTHPTDSIRWADPVPQRHPDMYSATAAGPGSTAQMLGPTSYTTTSPPPHQRTAPQQAMESPEGRKRMGSQDEAAYNQALIMHQRARKDRLRRDLNEEQRKLELLRSEIGTMEQDLNTKRAHNKATLISPDQLNKLREEKRQLQIDIECMNNEIEQFKKQASISIGNQRVHFYENMGTTGPNDPIPPAPMASGQALLQPRFSDPDEGQQWSCTHCTFLNHPFLDKCECCEMPRDNP